MQLNGLRNLNFFRLVNPNLSPRVNQRTPNCTHPATLVEWHCTCDIKCIFILAVLIRYRGTRRQCRDSEFSFNAKINMGVNKC